MFIPGATPEASIEILGAENVRLHTRQEMFAARAARLEAVAAGATDVNPDETWLDYSNCYGINPDLFLPERGADTQLAKAVCKACVAREECLEYALTNNVRFGIWGGLTERERRRIRRQRALGRTLAEIIPSESNDTDPGLNS